MTAAQLWSHVSGNIGPRPAPGRRRLPPASAASDTQPLHQHVRWRAVTAPGRRQLPGAGCQKTRRDCHGRATPDARGAVSSIGRRGSSHFHSLSASAAVRLPRAAPLGTSFCHGTPAPRAALAARLFTDSQPADQSFALSALVRLARSLPLSGLSVLYLSFHLGYLAPEL